MVLGAYWTNKDQLTFMPEEIQNMSELLITAHKRLPMPDVSQNGDHDDVGHAATGGRLSQPSGVSQHLHTMMTRVLVVPPTRLVLVAWSATAYMTDCTAS